MGTPGPVGFEPGMFKKESEEHKAKSDSANKVYNAFCIIKDIFIQYICILYVYS